MADAASIELAYQAHVRDLSTRTKAALVASGHDELLIHSGSPIKRSQFDDQFWPLRLVPHFQHWAHLPWPDCAIHVRANAEPELYFVRDRSFWERAPEPDWRMLSSALRLTELRSSEEIGKRHGPRTAFIGENMARAASWGIEPGQINPPELLSQLDELRVTKSSYEIACLAEANRIAARGHEAVKRAFDEGERSELKLHLAYLAATGQDDPETPYKNIVAVGESAAILHHVHYARDAKGSASLLVDAGAAVRGYASDITRTHCARDGRQATDLFASLLEQLDGMQQQLCRSVRIGRPYEELHDEAHARLGRVLTETGIVRTSAEACVSLGISRMFLPHGLGHSLGLQCHDVGCARVPPRPENAWLRNTRSIQAGQVFTIEPGLYFIDTFMEELRAGPQGDRIDWKAVEAVSRFGGIRIEDDLVVEAPSSPSPTRNLTREVL